MQLSVQHSSSARYAIFPRVSLALHDRSCSFLRERALHDSIRCEPHHHTDQERTLLLLPEWNTTSVRSHDWLPHSLFIVVLHSSESLRQLSLSVSASCCNNKTYQIPGDSSSTSYPYTLRKNSRLQASTGRSSSHGHWSGSILHHRIVKSQVLVYLIRTCILYLPVRQTAVPWQMSPSLATVCR
jgi:hypothetical protein